MSKAPSLRLSPVKEKAAFIIANGGTQTLAAERCDKTKQTVSKWCKEENFQKRVDELRADFSQQADEILLQGVVDAAQTVVDVASGKLTNTIVVEGEEVEVAADLATLNPRLKAALWLLDKHQKGKLPKPTRTKESDMAAAEAEFTSEEEAEEMLTSGIPEDEEE
ncbi:hypothetical protein LCGC14_1106200 [marine sediment metagenome]|uniref:Homeodomain phBC6A51-type domain-containing protein n=1 Tax=marine sediment metagenome TaxID=412755 RepID=A0A0F9MCS7_9ZZZZ